jgi:hypothetical protein
MLQDRTTVGTYIAVGKSWLPEEVTFVLTPRRLRRYHSGQRGWREEGKLQRGSMMVMFVHSVSYGTQLFGQTPV